MADDKTKTPSSPSFIEPLKELIADSLELITDAQIKDDGILKDIPIAGSLLKAYKVVTGIKDQLFFRKLNRFFAELESIPAEDRAKFWADYEGNQEEKQKLGEQLIIYLDRHDSMDKPALLARAFGAYVNGQIQKEDFLDLALLIDTLQVHRLETIVAILLLAGGSRQGGFFNEISIGSDSKRFVPDLEAQRLLEYEEETKMVEDRYKGAVIKTTRKHRTAPLAQNFLLFVVPILADEIAAKIGAFRAQVNQARRARYEKEREEESKQTYE